MKLVFASSNVGKIKEIQFLLSAFNINVMPQTDFGVSDAPEIGLTYIENAIIKARHACKETGLPALADDSGLSVPALNGAPGIYSARYSGDNATSASNIQKLLHNLDQTKNASRIAYFNCVLVFMLRYDDPTPLVCHGQWQGTVLFKPTGTEGFGYDPIFFVPSENKSAAQLPSEIKNRISHRSIALRLLMEKLPEKLKI